MSVVQLALTQHHADEQFSIDRVERNGDFETFQSHFYFSFHNLYGVPLDHLCHMIIKIYKSPIKSVHGLVACYAFKFVYIWAF